MPVDLGELLLKEGVITPQQLRNAREYQAVNRCKLDHAVIHLGFVGGGEITDLLSGHYGVPSVNLEHFEVDPAILEIVPPETARESQVLPLSLSESTLRIATSDPANTFAMDEIRLITGHDVSAVVASETALQKAIDRCYGSSPSHRAHTKATDSAFSGSGNRGEDPAIPIPGSAATDSTTAARSPGSLALRLLPREWSGRTSRSHPPGAFGDPDH